MRPWFACAAAIMVLASARAELPRDASVVGIRLGMTLEEANAALRSVAPGRVLVQGALRPNETMGECGATHFDRDHRPGRTLQQDVAVALNQKGEVWCIWSGALYSRLPAERRPRWQDLRASLVARYGVPARTDEATGEIRLSWSPASFASAEECERQVEDFENRRGLPAAVTGAAGSRPPAECSPFLSVAVLLTVLDRRLMDRRRSAEPATVEGFWTRFRDLTMADIPR